MNTKLKILIRWIIVLIILGLLIYGGLNLYKSFSTVSYSSGAPSSDVQDLLTKVGQLAELPVGENPTVATVSDLNALKGQPFFNDAMIGDKVIIYSGAGKAILYRPSTDKIIVIAPINK